MRGVGHVQHDVLHTLLLWREPPTAGDIAKDCKMNRSAVYRSMRLCVRDGLAEEAGYVVRSDRRQKLWRLTPAGHRKLRQLERQGREPGFPACAKGAQ